ncbi:DUF1778 domain-containing protein [Georgenia sp. M64]|jgi:uncharacterized protein (DUF1778 family)|uniref:type II toxin-antitoxin system TacA family antitoxin n=1 Tax=Georgenia sp. M64 TaxID=3120520 RepID=UPI0030E25B15
MATKSKRLEMRVDEETSALLSRAASLSREPVSTFVTRAARAEAGRVLARADVTLMPAEQFDALMETLERADQAPALARAAARRRRFDRA